MIDNMFRISEASKMLACTPQNLYGMQDNLKKLGYWYKSETGTNYITKEGLNYLQDKRTETLKASKGFKELDNKDFKELESPTAEPENLKIINLLQEQIQELKEEKDYWKKQTEQKDLELKNKNDYIQELNTKAFALLGTAEDNKKQEENTKKGFFSRFFK